MKFFEEKVGFERRVLNVVNSKCEQERQLAGLTSHAIADWSARNPQFASSGATVALLNLACFYRSLGDFSGHVVDPEDVTVIGYDDKLHELEEMLTAPGRADGNATR